MADVYILDTVDPYVNLAVEEYLTLNSVGRALILWQNDRTVVIGNHQNAWAECDYERLVRDGGRLARRLTGGGAVYHDLGNLNFSFICDEESFSALENFEIIIRALARFGIDAEPTGRNDVTVSGKKISGNAFMHKKGRVLHHGTLLVNSDLTKLAGYLKPSKKKLETKGIKSVRSRVTNLADLGAVTVDGLKRAIAEEYVARYGAEIKTVPDKSLYLELAVRNSAYDFILGENPRFSLECGDRFSWGEVTVGLIVKGNEIADCKIYTDALGDDFVTETVDALVGVRYVKEEIEGALSRASSTETRDVIALVLESLR